MPTKYQNSNVKSLSTSRRTVRSSSRPFFAPGRLIPLMLLAALLLPQSLHAAGDGQARFVNGWSDGVLIAYAVIEFNGRQYRTDQMGSGFNMALWRRLSPQDRMKVARAYSHLQGHLRGDFGTEGQREINSFVMSQTGWSDLVEAMKERHANKRYPALRAAFGPDVQLEIPNYSTPCWRVRESDAYLDAVRLEREVRADFAVGRAIYGKLTNANWEQIGIAVKGISGPLLKIIVDNFITGFVTHGATAASELMAAIYNFQKDLRDFINDQTNPRNAELTPRSLIEQIEVFLHEMETTGNTAAALVETKLGQLEALAEVIRALTDACTSERREEAFAVRQELNERIERLPSPVPTQEAKAQEAWRSLDEPAVALRKELLEAQQALRERLEEVPPFSLDGNLERFLDCFTNGFDGHYRSLRAEMEEIDAWRFHPIPHGEEASELFQAILADALASIDGALPRIDQLEAIARGLNVHAHLFDFLPSEEFNRRYNLRNLDQFVQIVASEDRTLESVLEDIEDMQDFSGAADQRIGAGQAQRRAWLTQQNNHFNSLRFNFEASLSYNIAALRQLDRLHAENPYFQLVGTWTYQGVQIPRYRVNQDYIWAEINEHDDPADRLTARQSALERILQLHAEQEALLRRLEIARNFHEADRQAIIDFFATMRAAYGFSLFAGANQRIIADFQAAIGAAIALPDDLAAPLIDHVTDYLDPLGKWIRTPSNLLVPIKQYDLYTQTPSIVEQLTGKTDAYFQLLELHDEMGTDQARLLALPQHQFDAYYGSSWTRIGELQEIMIHENISVPGSPARFLELAAYTRLGNLRSLYRAETPDPEFRTVIGRVVTSHGVGVPNITLVLSPGTFAPRVTVTSLDGHFVFEHIFPGPFTIRLTRTRGYTFRPPQINAVMGQSDMVVEFVALPNDQTGFGMTGKIADTNGHGVGGIDVFVEMASHPAHRHMIQTLPDGTFAFEGLLPGDWQVEPRADNLDFAPEQRMVNLAACVGSVEFVLHEQPFEVSPDRRAHARGGGSGLTIKVRSGNMVWRAEADQPWILLTKSSGIGDGDVRYSVAANSGSSRTGAISIMNSQGLIRLVLLMQAGGESEGRGSLSVTIMPQAAVDQGAGWRRLGEQDWRLGQEPETELIVGSYWVEFSVVPGWDEPQRRDVTVAPEATAITAEYIRNPSRHAVVAQMSGGKGTVTGARDYLHKSVATLRVEPDPGYQFLYWSVNGRIVSTDAEYSFLATTGLNVVAHFERASRALPGAMMLLLSDS